MSSETVERGSLLRERWRAMIRRTSDPNHDSYASYGGRGIKVCERWLTFGNFLADMGPTYRSGLSLDRIDVDGDYEPGNVRWATASEQSRNRRDSRTITWQGRTMHVCDWADRLGIPADSLYRRLRRGWTVERTLTEAPQRDGAQHTQQRMYLQLLACEDALRLIAEQDGTSEDVRQQLSDVISSIARLAS